MKVCVAVECRFQRLPDGSVWTEGQYALPFWECYLSVFDHVRCLARVLDVERLDGEWQRADGDGVSFSPVPYYRGPGQCVRRLVRLRQAVRRSVSPDEAYVLRVPGMIGDLASARLRQIRHPYAVEVIGNPNEVFSPGAVRHPLRSLFRWYGTRQLRRQCADACAASYVTEHALQKEYPSSCASISASDIELDDDVIAAGSRTVFARRGAMELIFVGSLEQYYKGPDVLIRACAACVARGINLRLTIVGHGRLRPALEALASQLGCRDRVRFTGPLSRQQVYRELDRADLFVLPSRTEGLPRAMIEAMARGLPCIGTAVGGIPELLSPETIVRRGDTDALAGAIVDLIGNPFTMSRLSARNLEKAGKYRTSVLRQRRIHFYRMVREATEASVTGVRHHAAAVEAVR